MMVIRIVSAALLTVAALAVHAQESTVQQPTSAGAAMNGIDCAAARRARHDHGIERGYGPMPIKGCSTGALPGQESAMQQPISGASASARSSEDCAAARRMRHDHGIERGYGPVPIKGCSTASKL